MRLIDADPLRDDIETINYVDWNNYSDTIDFIDDAPTIEAQPVRHGVLRLMHNSYDRVKEYNCSSCDANHIREYNFCPSCGARMVGGDNST